MKRQGLPPPNYPDSLFDPCIKCTICVSACPVAQVTTQFPGPKQAGPDAQRFRGRGEPVEGSWINLCLGCYRCQVACPADVPIAEINLHAKGRYAAQEGRDLPTRLLTRSHIVSAWGQKFRLIVTPLLNMRWSRWFAEKLFGVDRKAPMPGFAKKRFAAEVEAYQPGPGKRKVAYFYGCFTDNNAPEVGRAILRVLEAAGVEVVFPSQQCCGAALVGAGDFAAARQLNELNMHSLRQALEQGCEAIVVGSPSCALALSHETATLLGIDAVEVSDKIVDLFTYLHRLQTAGELNWKLREQTLHAAFHEACHLTALGLGANAPAVLRRIPGVKVSELDAGCCGLGGTFGLKRKTGDIARDIGRNVAERVAELQPDVIISECEGCRMQIEHLTGVPARHPAEILAQALGQD